MRTFKFLLTTIFLLILNQRIFSQINSKDLKFVADSKKNQIEVFQISTSAIIQDLKVNKMTVDIFDKDGNYSGTINLTDWKINMEEISPDEFLKISYALLVDKTGNKIELKDIRISKK